MSFFDKNDIEPPNDDMDFEEDGGRILRVNKIDLETEKAIGIKDAKGKVVWLPKSQIKIHITTRETTVLVPEWLADANDTLEYDD